MSLTSKIALIKEMIESAESNLRSAKQILNEAIGGDASFAAPKPGGGFGTPPSSSGSITKGQVVEGTFNGQNMTDSENSTYTVPANYISKSKLIEGDTLKLIITDEGRFIYKQIGPVPRKYMTGVLSYDNGQYQVLAGGKAYKVITAAITYYHAEIGDEVTIIVPEVGDSQWAAVENVLPKGANTTEEDTPEDAKEQNVKIEGEEEDEELEI